MVILQKAYDNKHAKAYDASWMVNDLRAKIKQFEEENKFICHLAHTMVACIYPSLFMHYF